MRPILQSVCAFAAVLAGSSADAGPPDQSVFTAQPSIAAPDGRWDFATWDGEHHRLLVAHGQDVLVIDPATGSVRPIGAVAGAHAALAIPGTNRILVSSGKDDRLRILDADSGAEVARITVAGDPDAAILSGDGKTAYVMGAKAGAVSVVDLAGLKETARIPLKPALEVPVIAGTLLAVNDEDAGEIELADLTTGKPSGAISLPGCEGPTGMAYAPPEGLALSACANGKAVLVDLARRRVVALLPIGLGPDTVIWDQGHRRFLVPCGKSGTVAIIAIERGKPRVLPPAVSEMSARTAAYDAGTGRLYLPAARFQPAAGGGRPAMVPGSFHIAVLKSTD